MTNTRQSFERRKAHTRKRLHQRARRGVPRLSVFRSHKHIYAQVVDDENGITLAGRIEFGEGDQGEARQGQ